MKFMKNEEGVSPVIGVILMVAITVILAAVIAVFVFGLAGDLESSSQKDVTLTSSTASSGDVLITVFAGSDIESLSGLRAVDANADSWAWDSTMSAFAVGATYDTGLSAADGPIIITGTFTDGTAQVLARVP